MTTKYPRPDRANFVPVLQWDGRGDSDLDLVWAEGVFSDGRPWRAEEWAGRGQGTFMTVYFARDGLERATKDELKELLISEGLLVFRAGAPRYVNAVHWQDATEHAMWAVTIVVGNDEDTFVLEDVIPWQPYDPEGRRDMRGAAVDLIMVIFMGSVPTFLLGLLVS